MILGMAGFEQFAEGDALNKGAIGMFKTVAGVRTPLFSDYQQAQFNGTQITKGDDKKYYSVFQNSGSTQPSLYVDLSPLRLGLARNESGVVYFSARVYITASPSSGTRLMYAAATDNTSITNNFGIAPQRNVEQFIEAVMTYDIDNLVCQYYVNGVLTSTAPALPRANFNFLCFGVPTQTGGGITYTNGNKALWFGMTDVTLVLDKTNDANKTGRLGAIRVLPLPVASMTGGTKWSATPSGTDPVAVVNKPVGNQVANMASVLNTDAGGEFATFKFDNTMTGDIKGISIGINASRGQLAQTSLEHTITDGTNTTTPVTTVLPADQGASMISAGGIFEKTLAGTPWTPAEIGKLGVKIRSVPAQ